MRYPLEVYKVGESRVIWGPEEHAMAKAEGWTDERHLVGNSQESQDSQISQKRRGRPPRVQVISEVA